MDFTWLVSLGIFFLLIVSRYVYFYVQHRVYGAKLLNVRKSSRNVSFKTKSGRFQVDKKREKLMYKETKSSVWKTVPFHKITEISILINSNTAGIFEFLFSDFNFLDFNSEYRDVVRTCYITLGVDCAHPDINLDINLMTMKQYEQREFFLGQLLYELDIWIMSKLGFYTSIKDVSEDTVKELMLLFRPYGLDPKCNRPSYNRNYK